MDRWTRRSAIIATLSLLAIVIPCWIGGCAFLRGEAAEAARGSAAEAISARAAQAGIDLRRDYPEIDPARDDPRTVLTKIVKAEVQRGNGELAALLADVEKVRTLGDAIAVVMAHRELGGARQEAIDAASRTAKGLGLYGLFATGAAAVSWLRKRTWAEAAAYLVRKIEAAGDHAEPVKVAVANPNPHEESPAATASALAEALFPGHSS